MDNNSLNLVQAAQLVGIPTANFRYYCKTGRAPIHKKWGREFVFQPEDLVGWTPDKRKPGKKKGVKNEPAN